MSTMIFESYEFGWPFQKKFQKYINYYSIHLEVLVIITQANIKTS